MQLATTFRTQTIKKHHRQKNARCTGADHAAETESGNILGNQEGNSYRTGLQQMKIVRGKLLRETVQERLSLKGHRASMRYDIGLRNILEGPNGLLPLSGQGTQYTARMALAKLCQYDPQ